jgi:hypothetical protein
MRKAIKTFATAAVLLTAIVISARCIEDTNLMLVTCMGITTLGLMIFGKDL